MAQITEKELGIIKDRLGDEENLVAKYRLYASMTQDSEMKSNFEQIARARGFTGLLPAADTGLRAADPLSELGLSQAALDADTGDGG